MKIEYIVILALIAGAYTAWWYLSRMHNIAEGKSDKYGNLK
jgi:hypothetical protein